MCGVVAIKPDQPRDLNRPTGRSAPAVRPGRSKLPASGPGGAEDKSRRRLILVKPFGIKIATTRHFGTSTNMSDHARLRTTVAALSLAALLGFPWPAAAGQSGQGLVIDQTGLPLPG